MARILKWLPEILLVAVLGFIAYNLVCLRYEMRDAGVHSSSFFALACIAEKGNFFENLFQLGSVSDGEWWYGIGFDFCAFAFFPVIFYILLRGSLILRKKTMGERRSSTP